MNKETKNAWNEETKKVWELTVNKLKDKTNLDKDHEVTQIKETTEK